MQLTFEEVFGETGKELLKFDGIKKDELNSFYTREKIETLISLMRVYKTYWVVLTRPKIINKLFEIKEEVYTIEPSDSGCFSKSQIYFVTDYAKGDNTVRLLFRPVNNFIYSSFPIDMWNFFDTEEEAKLYLELTSL